MIKMLNWFARLMTLTVSEPASGGAEGAAAVPWKVGEVVAVGGIYPYDMYRKFLGVTAEGEYLVQAFYKDGDVKYSDPYRLKRAADVTAFLFDKNQSVRALFNRSIEGPYVLWHINGQKFCESQFENGFAQGMFRRWWANGQKAEEGLCANGREQGRWVSWYDNGQESRSGEYINGLMEGRWLFWYDNGQKECEGDFANGKTQGEWSFWYNNGMKRAFCHCQEDQWHGTWMLWHPNGQKWKEGEYRHDEKVGHWREWDKNGVLVEEDDFGPGSDGAGV